MAQVNIRLDDNLKEEGEKLFNSLGMNFSTAVSVFVSQSVREGGLPFAVTTKALDRADIIAKVRAAEKEVADGASLLDGKETLAKLRARYAD